MNLNYILKKKHIIKKRKNTQFYKFKKLSWGVTGLAPRRTLRFELYYLIFFKKFLVRRYLKLRTDYPRLKYWILIRPNTILSQLSINSRMGSGVGLPVRLAYKISAGRSFLEYKYFSRILIRRWFTWLRFKVKFPCFIVKD